MNLSSFFFVHTPSLDTESSPAAEHFFSSLVRLLVLLAFMEDVASFSRCFQRSETEALFFSQLRWSKDRSLINRILPF